MTRAKHGPNPPPLDAVAGHIRRHGSAISASVLSRILTEGRVKDGRLVQGSLRKLERAGEVKRLGRPGRYAPAKW